MKGGNDGSHKWRIAQETGRSFLAHSAHQCELATPGSS